MRKINYKYNIDAQHKTVVARSTFAGRTVVGIAKCMPEDEFDIEQGKKLATARCNLKIAKKRLKYAENCAIEAADNAEFWANQEVKMKHYEQDSLIAYQKALTDLIVLEKLFE